jgi:hypothetical protein
MGRRSPTKVGVLFKINFQLFCNTKKPEVGVLFLFLS